MRFQADFLDCQKGDHISSIEEIADQWGRNDTMIDFDEDAKSNAVEQIEAVQEEVVQQIDRSKLIEKYTRKIVDAADKVAPHLSKFYDIEADEWLDGGRKMLMEVGWGKFAYTTFYNTKADSIIECVKKMNTQIFK